MKKLLFLFTLTIHAFDPAPYYRKKHYDSTTVTLHPGKLVHVNRFDVMAKYLYARHRAWGVHDAWALEVYREHLAVWNNFIERVPAPHLPIAQCAQQYIQKTGFKEFLDSFNALLDTVEKEGFNTQKSVIPVDENFVLMDGGHRTAAGLLYNIPLTCRRFFKVKADVASADYFRHRTNFVKTGLRTEYLDAMALEYFRLKEPLYLMILFPQAMHRIAEVKSILGKYGAIAYTKKIELTERGAFNLLHECYRGEPWIGTIESNFGGLHSKKNQCFPQGKGTILVILFEAAHVDIVKRAKKEVRSLFNIGNSSVHSVDTHAASFEFAQTVCNSNGVHWINHAYIRAFERFEKYVHDFKQNLQQHAIDPELLCIDGSAVLSAYGFRDCADLDLIHQCDIAQLTSAVVQSHHSELPYHGLEKEYIIFNPAYHFYLRGIKFVSLMQLATMKKQRGEPKDLLDLVLIEKGLE
ncbi:MAG: hypothetical protein WCE21_04050 [Candidatus Babeliales bacterium]